MPRKSAKAAAPVTPDHDIARRIWLAGVGAYGRAFADAQGEAQKLAVKADEAFDQLVLRGEVVEDQVKAMIGQNPQAIRLVGAFSQAAEKAKAFRVAQTERLGEVRKQFGAALESVGAFNPLALTARVEALEAELAALKAAKAPARRAASKPAARAAKPVAKKAARGRKAKA